jgi:hypothetical protein
MKVTLLIGNEEKEFRHIHLLKVHPTTGCEFKIRDSGFSGLNVRIDDELEIRPVATNSVELDFVR